MTESHSHRNRELGELGETAGVMRAAWRADEEEWTRAALEAWEHGRALVDIARDCMYRGDTVAVVLASHTFTGTVVVVGDDVIRVATADGAVDIRHAEESTFFLRVVANARTGGSRGERGVETFRARLLELEAAGVVVEIGCAVETMSGALRVGRDHVALEDRETGRVYLPMGSVVWVRPVDVD